MRSQVGRRLSLAERPVLSRGPLSASALLPRV